MKGGVAFVYSYGEVDFNLVPFPMRETVIPGLLIQWMYIKSLTLGNTDSLTGLSRLSLPQALVQPHMEKSLFKAIEPQMLEESQGSKSLKKKKNPQTGTNSYFTSV